MTTNDPVEVLRRVTEQVNAGDMETVSREWLHPDFVRHDLAGMIPDSQGVEENLVNSQRLMEALDDVEVTMVDAFASEGGRVAARLEIRGRFVGEIAGHAPTGERFSINGMGMYRTEDGRLAEAWVLMDLLALVGGRSPVS